MREITRKTLRSLGRIALLLGSMLVLIALVLPRDTLRFLRLEYVWLGRLVDSLEARSIALGVNLAHVLAFVLMGMALRIVFARQRLAVLVAAVVLVAVVTEIVQVWLPGRTARVSDTVTDMLSAAAGILAVQFWRSQRQGSAPI